MPGSDGLIWRHIGRLAATVGGIGLNMRYRDGPSATLATGAEDLRLVIEWIAANVGPYGGDPGTIVLLANAEGATRAAAYLFSEDRQPPSSPGVAAAQVTACIAALRERLCRKYADCPSSEQLQGHKGVSHLMSLRTPDTSVSNALIRLYHTVR